VTTGIEHESVLATAREYKYREARVNADGIVDIDHLISLIDDNTVLVSVMYANNEMGAVQPIRQVAQALDAVRKARKDGRPLYFHTDAAQAAAYLDLHTARLGVDLLTINAGKIYGPKQAGALFVSSKVALNPQVAGGGQERGLRSGTENVAGAIGLAAALTLVQERRHQEVARLQGLQASFFRQLEEAIPSAVVNGSRKFRLPNNVHITIPGADNERLIFQLDDKGILCAAGSACSADSGEPSHVLKAMGLSDDDARASLRFTMGCGTTEAEIQQTAQILHAILSR
jgi:cysteine desulfurase